MQARLSAHVRRFLDPLSSYPSSSARNDAGECPAWSRIRSTTFSWPHVPNCQCARGETDFNERRPAMLKKGKREGDRSGRRRGGAVDETDRWRRIKCRVGSTKQVASLD